MTKCEYCGKTKQDDCFFIGASKLPDWTMVEGTGKMTCPECHAKAVKDGKEAIEKHIKHLNSHVFIVKPS